MNFYPDKIFSFQDLPEITKADFLVQFDGDFEFTTEGYYFKLKLISYEKLAEELDEVFGPNLIDAVEDDYIVELANNILQNGLQNPPIGSEGIHRTLAHFYLKKDMLRFKIFASRAPT